MAKEKEDIKQYDVVAIGNAIVDILVRADDSFLSNHDIEKGVMTLTDRVTVDKLYLNSKESRKISGGSAANTAVGVTNLGGSAAFIGKVGEDILGNIFVSDIRKTGVHFHFTPPEHISDETTACSYVIITPDAQRTMLTYLGVASQIAKRDIREDIIQNSKILYIEGYLWDLQEMKDLVMAAIKMAKKYDKKVAFTLSDPFCVSRHRGEFLQLIKDHVDILFANESELTSLYQENETFSAIEKIREDCDLSAITCGENGSHIVTQDDVIDIKPIKVDKVVDTTGAGDLYAAGFLFGYCNNNDLEECGRLASVSASQIITQIGARP